MANRLLAQITGLFVAAGCAVPAARASGDAEWQAFRTAVGAACTAAASASLDEVAAKVDPFGSESYGLALMSGIEKGTRDTRSVICVYDKKTKRAEVGGPLDLQNATQALADFPVAGEADAAQTPATLIYPGSATCGQDCLAHWTALSQDDQNQLIGLPEQVRRTLAEKPPAGEAAPVATARRAAASIIAAVGGNPGPDTAPDASGIAPGERRCTLYWFGFMAEPSRTVGTHRCRVDTLPGGGLSLAKLSGDNLVVQVQLLADGLLVVGGRSAPSGPPPGGYDLSQPFDPKNPNYGNKVGLGIAGLDGRLMLASIDERGMEPKDPNFFELLVVDPPQKQ